MYLSTYSENGVLQYCSYNDYKGHKTIYCWALRKYLETLIQQDILKEYILTPEVASRSDSSMLQHLPSHST